MCSPAIAERLRQSGHDVVATLERDDLRGLSDELLLTLAGTERRALATFDLGDFSRLAARFRAEEREHHGLVLISPRRFSPSAEGVGAIVRALDGVLRTHLGDDELLNAYIWLGAAYRA